MRKDKSKNGAGVILLRDFDGVEKVLVLLSTNKKFDIPKGHSDYSDFDKFSTAQRECFEETDIFITLSDRVFDDVYQAKHLTIFVAKTNQDPVLKANPETKKFEHTDFYWLEPDVAAKILPGYLSRAVLWYLNKRILNT